MNNRTDLDKNLYKIFLGLVKYLPVSLALIQITCTILNSIGINLPILTCLGGTSILFIALLWIIGVVFKFCYLYKIPLVYITLILFMISFDCFIGIPLDVIDTLRLHYIISGLFIILFIYYMYKNRNNPKVDYVAEFCKRYCSC